MTQQQRTELSMQYHDKKYNCCQSVLLACGDLTGLPEETAAPLGCGFGGGMYCGEVCGAVSGAQMAIGAACLSGVRPEDARPISVKLTKAFQKRFKERFGSILCRDIRGDDGKKVCQQCIICAANMAAETIESFRKARELPVDNIEQID